MNKSASFAAALFALSAATTALAAPGEWWEIATKSEMPGMPFAMPAQTMKVCVGKEDADNPRKTMQDKDCKMTDMKTSGNKTTWKMRCDRNGEVMTGDGEFTSLSDGYQGMTHLKGTSGGRPFEMSSNYRGKRTGAKCDTSENARSLGVPAGKPAPQQPSGKNTPQHPTDKAEPEQPSGSLTDQAKKLKGMFGL